MKKTPQKSKTTKSSQLPKEIDRVFSLQMENRYVIANSTSKQRIQKLKKLLVLIENTKQKIHQALYEDIKKPASEVNLSEIFFVTTEIKHAIRHLKTWMKPRKVKPTLALLTTSSYVRSEPKGVVLIISPWNYPFNLAFGPLVSAIAAGNCCILKPSEFTPATNVLIKEMINQLFPENEIAVFEGDKKVAAGLLKKPFHHIFFTGSPAVGKIVMKAAAEHLTTVTLELGGKSPVIVDDTANIQDAAEKIVWGKFTNNGQSCIAPDYLLVPEEKQQAVIEALKNAIQKIYGETEETRQNSPDYGRIINKSHHLRLVELIDKSVAKGAKIEIGGITKPENLYLAPTILSNITPDSPVMQEEIFGPVLPALSYKSLDEALSLINSREKPLALYVFGKKKKVIQKIFNNTSAGGSCVNDVMLQYLHPNLPFGGINNSGFGNSHGIYGFKAFSHERAVLVQAKFSPLKMFFPPYTNFVKKLIDLTVKYL